MYVVVHVLVGICWHCINVDVYVCVCLSVCLSVCVYTARNDAAFIMAHISLLFNSFSALAYFPNVSEAPIFLNNYRQLSLWSRIPLLIGYSQRSQDCYQ